MGKKKPQKTKELSVAIAEASTTGEETQQQQTPRKRGRPRKIVEKTEGEEKKEEAVPAEAQAPEEVVSESQSKRVKTSEEEEQEQEVKQRASLTSMEGTKKGEGQSVVERELPPRRSRARRKSKPRKSS
ncbi:FK506-binding protein 4-like [Melia azedarach]|uniref:FK506-binding protein 4-like n=2 Tax=Melia azedarach TaxID=155640 RepID=A0ACC1WRX7_MELAZ|nr:FK506-binding protein 4-like [Melia azedarach]KAJ4701927.1 FK506-binding protein 4-like [Melia azedarach]